MLVNFDPLGFLFTRWGSICLNPLDPFYW